MGLAEFLSSLFGRAGIDGAPETTNGLGDVPGTISTMLRVARLTAV
jgi:hypothetical protein